MDKLKPCPFCGKDCASLFDTYFEGEKQLEELNKRLQNDPQNTDLLLLKHQMLSIVGKTAKDYEELNKVRKELLANGVRKNSEQYQELQREIDFTKNKYYASVKCLFCNAQTRVFESEEKLDDRRAQLAINAWNSRSDS